MTQLATPRSGDFRFRAIDSRGAAARGRLTARDEQDAYRQIAARGMKPVRITAVNRDGLCARLTSPTKRVTAKDLAYFTHQFAVLTEARIPIIDGLESIAEQESNPRLRGVITDIAHSIGGGSTVTEALGPHRELFGDVYVETLRAAETSGNMIEVLNQLSSMLERQYEINKQVRGALMYPMCVITALSLALVFLLMFAVPRFVSMFEARNMELPLPTQIVLAFSHFTQSYWYLLLAGLIGGAFIIRHGWREPHWRCRIDRWLHRVPFLRDVLRGLAISRFAHVFGICMRSGLGLIEALEMSGKASGRPMLIADTEKMRDQVKQGGRLTDVLFRCAYLPPFTRRMLASGEESAEMSRMCDVVARHYDREVGYLTKNVATVIEPIMIVALAAIILVVALAMFLPMWNMAELMR
jgi:MSHA biogenesis protein MshG